MGEDITHRFDAIEVTEEGLIAMEAVRQTFKAVAIAIERETVPGRAQAIALTELESAHRAANRAIAEANRRPEDD